MAVLFYNMNQVQLPATTTEMLLLQFAHYHITLTRLQVPTTQLLPHTNTHFNHLDFHYHSFLFSLLNLVLLTTEP